jgi:transglutaminase-like putative cysteine protease
MAAERQAAGEADRRLLVASLVALGAVTGATFGRVFAGTNPAVRLAVGGAVAAAIAALLVRRNLGVSLLASAAGLMVGLGVLVFPGTTWAGLPTEDTIRALLGALGEVGERAAQEIAPAPPFPSLMTAGLIAVWAAATAAHALSVRSRSPVLALLPPATLLAFSAVVTQRGPRPGYVLAFLAVAFALLFAAAAHRVAAWGPAVRPRKRSAEGIRWARWLGLGAAAAAVLLPGILPGFGSGPFLRLNRPGARVAISPIVDIRPSLLRNPPADLFTVEASHAAYWRLVTLDRFDGRVWTSSDLDARDGEQIQSGLDPLGEAATRTGLDIEQVFEIGELSTPWLPAAYRPSMIQLEEVITARWDPDSGTIATDDEPDEGFRYAVVSRVPLASPHNLNGEDPRDSTVDLRYVQLPAGLPYRIRDIALDITRDGATPFQKLLAIQDHLRTFTYDERAPAGHGVDDMLFFLERSQRGYCEQFAGTMAVLARSLGYPSRVAVGFLPGEPDRAGHYRVTTDDVHAWTEVHFPPYGWLAFEPTPTRDNPVAGYLTQVPTALRPDANLPRAGGAAQDEAGGPGASQREARDWANRSARNRPTPPALRRRPDRGVPLREILLILGGTALAGLLLTPPLKAAGRAVSLARAATPRRKVLAAYRTFSAGAADLGLARRRGETLWEYRSRMSEQVALSDGHLDRLTGLTGRALYSAAPVSTEEAAGAVADARTALRDLRKHAGALRVAAGAVRPPRRTG